MIIHLISPKNEAIVSVKPKAQDEIIASLPDHNVGDSVDWFHPSINNKDSSSPTPVMFTWGFEGSLDDVVAINLYIADNDAFLDCRAFSIAPGQMLLPVTNLLINKTYYWKMTALGFNGPIYETAVQTFQIENTMPQWFYVKGSTNLRDTGGWDAEDGKKLRFGMIYRGAELDNNFTATKNDIAFFANRLKIKTDLDFRTYKDSERDYSTPIPNAKLVNIPISAYAEIDFDEQKPMFKQIFDLLADEKNYPIYMHCIAGADRTGTVIMLLKSLLGVSEEDALFDYELTSLSVFGFRSRYQSFMRSYKEMMQKYGATPKEQAENYLLSCGVSKHTLEQIKNILTI